MRNIKLICSCVAVSFLISACNIYNHVYVTSDKKDETLLYKTFTWLPVLTDTMSMPYTNRAITTGIIYSIEKSFIQKGFALGCDSADILLQVELVNKKLDKNIIVFLQPDYFSKNFGSDYSTFLYNPHKQICYPMGYCIAKIEYVESSITLNVIDRKQRKLFWSCTATGNVYEPSFIAEDMKQAVNSIMKKFPSKYIQPEINAVLKTVNSLEKTVSK